MRISTLKTKRARGRAKALGQSGQALILAAVGMFAFVACAGLAVDMGYLRYQRRLQQTAADSAALAGASAAGVGGNVSQSALDDSKLNGFENGVILPGAAHAVNVAVTYPFTFQGTPNAVRVQVTADHPNFFMRIFGPALTSTSFTTTATAQYVQARNCMFALPGGAGITINNTVSLPNCGVLDAQNLNGTGSLTAAAIGVHGTSSLVTTNPTVVTGILQTSDPFANMTAPGGGGGTNLIINNTNFPPPRFGVPPPVTINPGNYIGISIAATFTRNVIFNSGTYNIGGNGLVFKGSGHVSGNSVTFFLNGGINFSNSQRIQFTAPNNGAHPGILFFQKTSTAADTVNGAANSFLQGALYFPRATLTMNGAGSCNNRYMILIASTININTGINCPSDYTTLANGSPIKAAALVQ